MTAIITGECSPDRSRASERTSCRAWRKLPIACRVLYSFQQSRNSSHETFPFRDLGGAKPRPHTKSISPKALSTVLLLHSLASTNLVWGRGLCPVQQDRRFVSSC